MTRDQAKEYLRGVDPERKDKAIDAAVRRYRSQKTEGTHASTPAPAPAAPQVATRPKKTVVLGANMTRIRVADARKDASPAPLGLEDAFPLRLDSGCEQTMFPDLAFFPWGVRALPHNILIEFGKDDSESVAQGIGTAVTIKTGTDGAPVVLMWKEALYVPDLREPLIDIEQAYAQSGIEVRFSPHRDLVFHRDNGVVMPFDAPRGIMVRAPRASDMRDVMGPHDRTTDITRGRHPGPAGIASAETCMLWGARFNCSAERLRHLPDVTEGAPNILRNATPEHVRTEDHLLANAPRIKPLPHGRPDTDHFGQFTSSDYVGPFEASKHFGHRYMAALVQDPGQVAHGQACTVDSPV